MPLLDPDLLRRQQYAEGFWYLGIGFALVWFDFRFGALDLLPDPLGYAIIAYGSALLRPLHAWATNAYIMAIGLAIVTAFKMAAALMDIVYEEHVLGRLMEVVEAAVNAAMIWVLFQIVMEVAQRLNAGALANEASTHRFFLMLLIVGGAAMGAYVGSTGVNFGTNAGWGPSA